MLPVPASGPAAKAKAAGADAADAIRLEGDLCRSSAACATRGDRAVGRQRHRPPGPDRRPAGLRLLRDDGPAALAELVVRGSRRRSRRTIPTRGWRIDQISTTVPDIDMFDPDEPSAEKLSDLANEAEDAALSVEGVTNSDGASAFWGLTAVALTRPTSSPRSTSAPATACRR